MVDAAELDWAGAWAGAWTRVEVVAVVFVAFTVARVRAFRADVCGLAVLAVDVFAGVDPAADLTTCALPVPTTAAIRAVTAVAVAAVQRVMRLTRRRPAVRILVSRGCRSVAMETSDQGGLAIGVEVPVRLLRRTEPPDPVEPPRERPAAGDRRAGSRGRSEQTDPGYPVLRVAPYA